MQGPERKTAQRKMLEKDKEILMQSVIDDEDFKFYENFNYFKRQFETFDEFKEIFKEDFYDYELLKAALVRKHENIINYLLNDCSCRSRNPNKTNLEETPLHLSMYLNNTTIFEAILNKNDKIAIYDKNLKGETPLHAAFKEKRHLALDILLNYISSVDLTFSPDNDDDVLHFHIACIKKHMNSVKLYLALGFDVNRCLTIDSPEYSGLTPLLCLLSQNYYHTIAEFIPLFIDSGVDTNTCIPMSVSSYPGFTPLHFAVQRNSFELVELLLKNGAEWNRQDKYGKTPLHIACERNKNNESIRIVEALLNCSGTLAVITDKYGRTPIHSEFHLIFFPPYDSYTLNMLISKEPLTENLTDTYGLSLFHIVCTRNRPDLVNYFLESGANVNSPVSEGKFKGYTALHFAVYFNQKEVVELLLKRNALINMKTFDLLNTPLHFACGITTFTTLPEVNEVDGERQERISNDQPTTERLIEYHKSQLDIINLLISHGADIEAKNVFDFTPLFYVCLVDTSTRPNILSYISSKEGQTRFTKILKILFSNKADINSRNSKQMSIFHVICNDLTEVSDELIECLITNGADVNAVDKNGLTPLHYAAKRAKDKLIKPLLKYNANVNAECDSGRTPLQYAVWSYQNFRNKESITNSIIILLENGSSYTIKSESGKTLLHYAVSLSIKPLLKKLLYYGIDINVEDKSGNSIVSSLASPLDMEMNIEVLCVVFLHVQKLLALGFYVSEKLKKYCLKLQVFCKVHLLRTDFPAILDGAFDRCVNELNRSKSRKIDNYTSLYSFLLKNIHDLSKYVNNNDVRNIFEAGDVDEEFPLYGYLMKLRYKESVVRNDALKLAKESLRHAIGTTLPDLCYDSILRNLTNEEVINLKIAVGANEYCNRKRKLNVDEGETEETIKVQKQD